LTHGIEGPPWLGRPSPKKSTRVTGWARVTPRQNKPKNYLGGFFGLFKTPPWRVYRRGFGKFVSRPSRAATGRGGVRRRQSGRASRIPAAAKFFPPDGIPGVCQVIRGSLGNCPDKIHKQLILLFFKEMAKGVCQPPKERQDGAKIHRMGRG
jgi:hypothetical protein